MSLFDFFFPKRTASASVAKERLQIVLAHERAGRDSPDFLPRLQKELLHVVGKYIAIDEDMIRVTLGKAGAAIGAGSGLFLGGASGLNAGAYSATSLQQRYDMSYLQCMAASGNEVPQTVAGAGYPGAGAGYPGYYAPYGYAYPYPYYPYPYAYPGYYPGFWGPGVGASFIFFGGGHHHHGGFHHHG